MASKTPVEFRKDLEELLKLAADLGVAEDRLARRAKQMRAEEAWHGLPMVGAVFGAVEYALNGAAQDVDGCESGMEIAQKIQDAIDVVGFAMNARPDEVPA